MSQLPIPKLTNITITSVCQTPNGTEMRLIHKDRFVVAMYYVTKNSVAFDFPMSYTLTAYERQEIEQFCTYNYKYFVNDRPVRMQFNLSEGHKVYEEVANTVMEKIYRASGLQKALWQPDFTRDERLFIWDAVIEKIRRMSENETLQ